MVDTFGVLLALAIVFLIFEVTGIVIILRSRGCADKLSVCEPVAKRQRMGATVAILGFAFVAIGVGVFAVWMYRNSNVPLAGVIDGGVIGDGVDTANRPMSPIAPIYHPTTDSDLPTSIVAAASPTVVQPLPMFEPTRLALSKLK